MRSRCQLALVTVDECPHPFRQRLLRAGQNHVHAEQLGLGTLGEPQRQRDARRVVVLTLLDGCHRHVEEQREGDDQHDRRDELDDAQPRPLNTGEPDEAAGEHGDERPEEGAQRAHRGEPPAPGVAADEPAAAAVVVRDDDERAGRGPVSPGDHVLRRAPAEQPPRRRERAAHVEQGEEEGGEREGRPRDGQLDGQRASHDREPGVERVRERPGGPDAERLELGLSPQCPQPAGEMAGRAPLGVGAGSAGAEAVDERLGLGERVDRHRPRRG